MKLRTSLLALIAVSCISIAHAGSDSIQSPIYPMLKITAENHLKAFGFFYLQRLKKDAALQQNAHLKYLNETSDKMTYEQMMIEDAKFKRSDLDQTCLNIYLNEIAMLSMGDKVVERLKHTYEQDVKKVREAKYDCNENLERITQEYIVPSMN